MLISEAVLAALEDGEVFQLNIIADWIEDNASGHREAETYCLRLRDWKSVRVQTLIDVIAKFGSRKERREICRIQRLALRCRKNTQRRPLRELPKDLFSLSSRRIMNEMLGNIIPNANRVVPAGLMMGGPRYETAHKRTVLMNCRHRHAFLHNPKEKNTWWFLVIIRQLLRVTHSSG